MPQIELMQSDLPHTLYGKAKHTEDGTKVTDDVIRKQMEANRKAYERRKEKRTLESLFSEKENN